MLKKVLFPVSVIIICLMVSGIVHAQGVHPVSGEPLLPCGRDEAAQALFKYHPQAKFTDEKQVRQKTGITPSTHGTIYTIPVVVHILHNGGAENISDANVYDAMRMMNTDYRRLAPDTNTIATAFKSTHGGLPEPLCAIYEKQSQVEMLKSLTEGISCPRKFLINSDVALIKQLDKISLENINTPEDHDRVLSYFQMRAQ